MSDYGSIPPPPPPPLPPPSGYGSVGAQGPPPPNYLVWAILSVLLCWPLSIAAIVFSTQVNAKWSMGDVAGAQDSSAKAKKFAILAAVVGVAVNVIAVIFAVAGGALLSGNSTGTGY